ncbi:MAG TPA: 50S ribosomal protein L29 [Candidatus Woesebacteria bacterium]|nr:50S ribosomal protein L29 [Candidatus Woesebacteria bacterium]HRS23134.1 50S ribosomal protein L29 [Candidatus Woesebacteria bacterium]HRT39799.1 50S ribosomal protein L29 [Candidatus Woesebacteria bacterium]
MKKTDKIAYRQKTKTELEQLLQEARKKYLESKSKFAIGNLKNTSLFKKMRYEIAFIKTLLKEKKDEK